MVVDTDKLAQQLYDASLGVKELPVSEVRQLLRSAHPGHDTIDVPENFRWFLVKGFPTKDLQITLPWLMKEAGSAAKNEKWQHDRIVDLLTTGHPAWPVFVTADGIIVDGYHRTAAHRTLGHKKIEVVVAVRRPGDGETMWDEMWNHNKPI